jgi:hypothetical protein
MVRVGSVAAALLLAVAPVNVGRAASDVASARDLPRLLLFSGTDLWSNGGFAYGGILWSPGGVDRDGFTVKLISNGGAYRYRSGSLGNITVAGNLLSAAILPGWRFSRDKLIATVFGGLDYQYHQLAPDDPSASLRGRYFGLRLGVDLWYEPTATTMAQADASLSSIGRSYNARAAYGWRAFDLFYAGPEVAAFTSNGYRQWRVGVHLTGFKRGAVEWSGGIGWAGDSDNGSGVYGRLGLVARR